MSRTSTDPLPGPTDTVAPAAPSKGKAALVVALLFSFMLVNYADKVVIGLAGVDLISELGITKEQFGLVQSSFFWLLAVGSVLGGMFIGRIKARFLLAAAGLLWAVSIAPMMGSVGFGLLIACRVLLGFAEGPATAMATAVTHSWYAPDKRAVPTSIVVAGAGFGPLIASPALTWVMLRYDWHAAFTVLFAVGVAWVLAWVFGGGEGPMSGKRPAAGDTSVLPETVPFRRLLGTRTVIGLLILFFTSYWSIAVKVSWLPLYLREGLGYSASESGTLVALPYAAAAFFQILVGVASAILSRRGATSRVARCLFAAALTAVGGLSTIGFSLLDRGAPQLLLMVVGASLTSAGYGIAFAAISDVVPARQRGGIMGAVVAVYSLGGIIAPLILGGLVESAATPADGYSRGFLAIGVLVVVGATVSALLTDPERDALRLAGLPSPVADPAVTPGAS
ncbi:MFS transporter [Streptomyces sp. NRRL B-24720]|uniref:MFS transporter n=1 Tax=Streptomyces sp. NRRL B-24720 TaxID=1476876 RepID=UPI00099C0312|nr:MFS transporter [Streptomyces sp. NRRL B-24720]